MYFKNEAFELGVLLFVSIFRQTNAGSSWSLTEEKKDEENMAEKTNHERTWRR